MWYENRSELYGFISYLDGLGHFTETHEPIRILEKPWKWEGEYAAYQMDVNDELTDYETEALHDMLSSGLFFETADKDFIRGQISDHMSEVF